MVSVTLRSRRDILRLAGGLAAGALFGARGASAASRARTLSLYAVNTGEHVILEYPGAGAWAPDALAAVSRLLRDHCTDQTRAIDPALLDQLHALGSALATPEPFHVVCGYRSPETNARKWHGPGGAASHSFHVAGRAVDVFVPGRDLRLLRTAAVALGDGRVGFYPQSGFVHLDTGPVRAWSA
jgi:uncharacterized protein YcbK (DUF882 family)